MGYRSSRCPDCWQPKHPARLCPVCRQLVHPTPAEYIAAHWDSAGIDLCPGERLAFNRAIPTRQSKGLMSA